MTAEEWVALVGIILGFIATNVGHIVTGKTNNNKMLAAIEKQSTAADAAIDKAIAVYAAKTDTKIEELTRETREHNQFARRIPIVETKIENLEKRVDAMGK